MIKIVSDVALEKYQENSHINKIIRLCVVIVILSTIILPSLAVANPDTIVVKLWVGNQFMEVNGTRIPIDEQGTKPIILESRTLVPIRAIIEAFGGKVGWDSKTRKVTIDFNNNNLELWIGQSLASLNGYAVQIDSANPKVVPMIINGRTMIPLRFVAESFGIDVQYEATSKKITLTYISVTTPVVQVLIPYRKKDKWGFCDRDKNLVIQPIYDDAYPFSEGLARVKLNHKRGGYIDTKGTQYWED